MRDDRPPLQPRDRYRMRRLTTDEMEHLVRLARHGRTGPSRMVEALWDLILRDAEGVTVAEAASRSLGFRVQDYSMAPDQARELLAAMTQRRRLPSRVIAGFYWLWLDQSPCDWDESDPGDIPRVVRMESRSEEPVPPEVAETVAELHASQASVMKQGIEWRPERWRAADLGSLGTTVETIVGVTEALDNGRQLIRRSHVAALTDPSAQFLAAMIWGLGRVGYGPSRVQKIVSAAGDRLVPSIEGIQSAARSGAAEAWDAFTRDHKLWGLGPAFATKVAYFAALADDQPGTGPLIADMNTSWAMWHLVKLPRSVELRPRYLEYVTLAQSWAAELGCRPDDVEWALFEIGKDVPRS